MKVAILGGKALLDVVFLASLSDEYPDLDIECYGDSGHVSYGARVLVVQNIDILQVSSFDIIINFSTSFRNYVSLVRNYNMSADKKVKFFNLFEGKLLLPDVYSGNEDFLLIPDYGVDVVWRFLKLFQLIKDVDIVMHQPVAELGKESMHQFHKEIKESSLRVIQGGGNNSDPLAFNISYAYPEDQNVGDCSHAVQEQVVKDQLSSVFKSGVIRFVNQARVPVNKGASVVLSFSSDLEISLKEFLSMIENAGLLYSKYGFSTILVENDSAIYVTKLKKIGASYSVVLVFDSLQRMVANVLEYMTNVLSLKN